MINKIFATFWCNFDGFLGSMREDRIGKFHKLKGFKIVSRRLKLLDFLIDQIKFP